MNAPFDRNRGETNQRALAAELARVRTALARHAGDAALAAVDPVPGAAAPAALDRLAVMFGLTSFERDVLLLCAGMELDASFAATCARAQGDARLGYPTFGLALAALPGAHWSALAPGGALRYWKLVELRGPGELCASRLAIDERVLHYITGVPGVDERLESFIHPGLRAAPLPESQRQLAQAVADALRSGTYELPVAALAGEDRDAQRAIARRAADALGCPLLVLRESDLPPARAERGALARLIDREALLERAAVLIDCGGEGEGRAGAALADELRGVTFLMGEALPDARRAVLRFSVGLPTTAEQGGLWRAALGEAAGAREGEIAEAASHFRLSGAAIAAAAKQLDITGSGEERRGLLWAAGRACARGALDSLAQRVDARGRWEDLVLPGAQLELLKEIVRQVRHRSKVYEDWGFAAAGGRGLGIAALFAGESGTGKTLAAEVLARELGLDLYRIELSAVVSRYLGESEKNLRRLFDAAESSGAILLFDEADALFGKRSEVRDSHDRYANVEIAYLLQRAETYRGLSILTTNMKSAIDRAFLRRIRFMVQFPFPDLADRQRMWRRAFPAQAPTQALDPARLARLSVTGGSIRNIALNAAFAAADLGAPVSMEHVLHAARHEYGKLEKPLTAAEIAGWL